MTATDTADGDVGRYLAADDRKTLLRFITCGSVDDGKSTLIGRLLYESKLIFDDQLAALEADSRRVGTQGGALDFALLVDGLAAEREQGITIDVAYRFFTTERRKFIVADTPGHEQYTRNMVTGASTADVAVILVDARKGVLTQTRRHTFIVSLLGIKHVALAVNKLDLVGYDQAVFDRITADYREFAAGLGLTSVQAIPISALRGDNVLEQGANTPWYDGPTLAAYLETVEVGQDAVSGPFRLPVQLVTRPDLDFRGYAGIIAGGAVRPGDEVRVLPSGATATGRADRHRRRRPAGRRGGAVGDPDPRPGDRHQPRRHDRRGGRPGRAGGPVRSPPRLDARRPAAAGPPVPDEARQLDRHLHRHPHQARDQRQHPGTDARHHAGRQRHRGREHRHRPAAAVRPVPGQPRDRRVRAHRPADQRHGRRRA